MRAYREFLEAKIVAPPQLGFEIDPGYVHPRLCVPPFEHQRDIVVWALRGGRRAIFASFGLGKTPIQEEIGRIVLEHEDEGAKGLIVCPLGVRTEFMDEARNLGTPIRFVRTTEEMEEPGLYLTNYESVREGKIDPSDLTFASLDEASVLRGLGTKTFREFYRGFRDVPFRYVATATPAPNEYIELLNYAMYLGVMDIGEAKTRFFQRNSEKADTLVLHAHKEAEFWLWVNTWAVFLQRPSDLGYSDEAYQLPPLTVRWHQVGVDHGSAGVEKNGQGRLLQDAAIGVTEDARARRDTLTGRIAKVKELVMESPLDHFIIWHDLEDERRAIEDAVPAVRSVFGSQDLEEREGYVADFARGRIARLAAKPRMLGSGCNLQRYCHRAIYAGVTFKFNDFIQSLHRIQRFLQGNEVIIDIVFAESQAKIKTDLERKWKQHDAMMARMSEIVRQYGLNAIDPAKALQRSIGVERRETRGAGWQVVNNDCVEETAAAAADVGLIVTSIPFSTQYEYTPSYNDFGHTDTKEHFFRQMDFLAPELLRVLKPGRVMCVHVKDRVRPGGYDNRSFQSIDPFHCDVTQHYQRHGFVYMGMITIVTDVVRENWATNRLGWQMQCNDGARMGVGLPEYVLLFRKAPTDNTNGWSDEPVTKPKANRLAWRCPECDEAFAEHELAGARVCPACYDEGIAPECELTIIDHGYSRARWQIDAHAFWKSNGNRLLEPHELVGRPWKEIFNTFRGYTLANPYDHERTVAIVAALDEAGTLPPDFMLCQPGVDHPDVWGDVMRARTLNTMQGSAGREKHLCPLQFDIVDRLINRFSNPGDVVFDPFAGLGTVPARAVALGRVGRGYELNSAYFDDMVRYCRAAAQKLDAPPTLFDPTPEPPQDLPPDHLPIPELPRAEAVA